MKKTRNTALLLVVSLFTTFQLTAQIKKDAVKSDASKPLEVVVGKPDTTKPKADELLESIQRDIRERQAPPVESNADGQLNAVEKVAEKPKAPPAPPKPPKIRKPHRPYHHELQLEAGAFLNQAFRVFGLVKDGEPYRASPYVLAYKYKLSTKSMEGMAIRLGLGGFFDRQEETIGNFADKKQTDTTATSARLGIEFQRDINDDFRWMFGADAILQNNQKRLFADSGIDQITDKTIGWTRGFGLMMGLRWDFTDRASIGSEMNIQFLNFQGDQTIQFSANPQFNKTVRRVNNTSTYYLGPANVYLSWRF
jgi:hypothetical protein